MHKQCIKKQKYNNKNTVWFCASEYEALNYKNYTERIRLCPVILKLLRKCRKRK